MTITREDVERTQDAGLLALCVQAAIGNAEFVANWTRLRGVKLPASALDRMIDEATGNGDAIAQQFITDVDNLFCQRLVVSAQEGR